MARVEIPDAARAAGRSGLNVRTFSSSAAVEEEVTMRKLLCSALLGAAMSSLTASAIAGGGFLETAPSNNGSGGVFMDLTPLGPSLRVTSFDVSYTGTSGTNVDVQVWTRPGSYVGFTGGSGGWTLTQTVVGTRGGTTVWTPLVLTTPILLQAGETTAVYLHCVTAGGGIRYTGTTALPPQTTWENGDLRLFSDVARTGDIAFGGTLFTPRTFSGRVHYELVPAPGAIALLGVAGLVTRRRRRS